MSLEVRRYDDDVILALVLEPGMTIIPVKSLVKVKKKKKQINK